MPIDIGRMSSFSTDVMLDLVEFGVTSVINARVESSFTLNYEIIKSFK